MDNLLAHTFIWDGLHPECSKWIDVMRWELQKQREFNQLHISKPLPRIQYIKKGIKLQPLLWCCGFMKRTFKQVCLKEENSHIKHCQFPKELHPPIHTNTHPCDNIRNMTCSPAQGKPHPTPKHITTTTDRNQQLKIPNSYYGNKKYASKQNNMMCMMW